MGKSWINLHGTSLGRHFEMSPGRQIGTSLGRQFGMSPGWSNGMFKGLPGDAGRERPQDVLGTNICRLGLFFETCCLCVFRTLNNKYACFVIYRNYILFFKSTNFNDYFVFELFLLLCFCFKSLDLSDRQSTPFDFSLSTLFVTFTSYGLKLLV